MTPWLILTATLPTTPSGLRVRIWRTLKATHCATLREGVYILPASAPSSKNFWAMDAAIREAGADAHLLEVHARDEAQEASFRTLFDRTALYADFARALDEARKAFKTASEAEVRRTLRALDQQLLGLLASDFFPSTGGQAAQSGLQALRHEVEQAQSPGEPATGLGSIARLAIADYQGKTWATRTRPGVDRLATAWLVQRFVDRSPHFLWLEHTRACPPSALGYDFDGATFTHVGDRVSFEVLAATFGLDADPALTRLGTLVHAIDIGGIAADEAPGVEMLVRGLRAQHANDDDLRLAATALFDTLYAALQQP